MINITQYEIADTADFIVTDANGNEIYEEGPPDAEGNPTYIYATIEVLSPGSKIASKAKFELDKARQTRVFKEMGGAKNQRTEEMDRKERADFLAVIAPKLKNFDYAGGPVALYSNTKLGHIADGVEAFFGKRGNFSVDLPTASSNMSDTQPG